MSASVIESVHRLNTIDKNRKEEKKKDIEKKSDIFFSSSASEKCAACRSRVPMPLFNYSCNDKSAIVFIIFVGNCSVSVWPALEICTAKIWCHIMDA